MLRESASIDLIRGCLTSSLLARRPLAEDEDLLTILDSLQILRLIIDLESVFGIEVDNAELTPENIGSVTKLAAFIAKKQGKRS